MKKPYIQLTLVELHAAIEARCLELSAGTIRTASERRMLADDTRSLLQAVARVFDPTLSTHHKPEWELRSTDVDAPDFERALVCEFAAWNGIQERAVRDLTLLRALSFVGENMGWLLGRKIGDWAAYAVGRESEEGLIQVLNLIATEHATRRVLPP